MDLASTLGVLLSIIQAIDAVPLVESKELTGVNIYEIDEMKKTSASLETLPGPEQKSNATSDDIFAKILEANKDSNILLREGDIALRRERSAIPCCRWPKSSDGAVYVAYKLSPSYVERERAMINAALEELMTLTCVRFVKQKQESDYVSIEPGSGCWSVIGKTRGSQVVSLSRAGCMWHGIIQHEVLHSLGFIHEHNRSDRDDYVDIIYKYIRADERDNFNKMPTNNLGLQYDYSSVMHYGRYAFSNTSDQATIIPKPNPAVEIGQRYGVSNLDVAKLNRLYQCDVCSSVLSKANGSLTSANYPSPYPNNSSCVWLIRLPSGQVSLYFNAFDVQSSKNCASDYIRVYDGATRSSPLLLEKACGTGPLPPLIASKHLMLLEFVSDGAMNGMGFKAAYSTVTCGGTFSKDNGNVTSPGFPFNYPNNANCIFSIIAPADHKISLKFTDFQMEYTSDCAGASDYLSVYDGSALTSSLLGKFCSFTELPAPVKSTGNYLLLQFNSDVWINDKGFRAEYSFVCVPVFVSYQRRQAQRADGLYLPPGQDDISPPLLAWRNLSGLHGALKLTPLEH
ncbi:astacin-like metalloendopeptidase [Spea bombifrons]|uniref:astacin-like metalloendopeptidase n=1 Tax=Spea bombifrons TaxID=233779 RepID=UPI00234A877B|nr:astacin-like metalloendopeptidase [Spea bombifrons]